MRLYSENDCLFCQRPGACISHEEGIFDAGWESQHDGIVSLWLGPEGILHYGNVCDSCWRALRRQRLLGILCDLQYPSGTPLSPRVAARWFLRELRQKNEQPPVDPVAPWPVAPLRLKGSRYKVLNAISAAAASFAQNRPEASEDEIETEIRRIIPGSMRAKRA